MEKSNLHGIMVWVHYMTAVMKKVTMIQVL